jgi:aminopeptidase N
LFFPGVLSGQNNYNIRYQRCTWYANPVNGFLSGEITSYYQSESAILNSLGFDLSQNLTVDSVKRNGLNLAFNHLNDKLFISVPSISSSTIDSVSVFYHGFPEMSGTNSFFTDLHSGLPVLWTLSEPYGAYGWWPCRENLHDKIDSLDIVVFCDTTFRAASIGLRISETLSQNIRRTHWKHRYPIATYLVAIAVAPYYDYNVQLTLPSGTNLLIQNMIINDVANIQNWQSSLPPTLDAISWLDSLLIPYPFSTEKYGHAQVPMGGGMEHQTMTFLNYPGAELFAHELAHQWFGNYITCGSWEDIWLNEGFATYFGGLAYKEVYTGGYFEPWLNEKRAIVFSEPDGSVFCSDTTNVFRIFSGRLSYAKAGMMLRMIEWEMGHTQFIQALRNYLNDSALIKSFAKTPALIAHFETVGDTSFSEFFNDWFIGEGFPTYELNWQSLGAGIVSLIIHQSQSHSSVDFFEMDLPIRFSDQNHDTLIRVSNTFSGQEYALQFTFSPDLMEFDPERWILTPEPVINAIPNTEISDDFAVFPNPANNWIRVSVPPATFPLSLTIYNIQGKIIKDISDMESLPLKINIESIPEGLNFIRIKTKNKTEYLKFIKF